MPLSRATTLLLVGLLSALVLSGCGGGRDATIGGTLSGLAPGQSVTLQNNGTDNLTLTSDQSFSFATPVASGSAYSVTLLPRPGGQLCGVANGTGTVDSAGDDVSNVAVTCFTTLGISNSAITKLLTGTGTGTSATLLTQSVAVLVSGLAAGTSVTLVNNGQSLGIAANGAFEFPSILAPGSTYDVTVTAQPTGQTCTIPNPTGSVVANTPAIIAVACN